VDEKFTEHLPSLGTVTTLASNTELSSSLHMVNLSNGWGLLVRDGLITATQAGSLSISINYSLSHSGVLATPDFNANGALGMGVGYFETPSHQFLVETFHIRDFQSPTLFDPINQHGTLRLTHLFANAGESIPFEIFAQTRVEKVPEPDMLWPTLAGMIGIAVFAERMRRQGHSVFWKVSNRSNY
jgi:hypothetical protein